MSKREVYVSVDIESDGPVPGLNSMLALGAAAFLPDGTEIGTWYSTLFPLANAEPDPDTTAWWQTQPAAWAEVNANCDLASRAMPKFAAWLDGIGANGKLIAAAWPASFDGMFTTYYLNAFAGRNPLGFAWLDIRSYMNGLGNWPGYQGFPIKEGRRLTGKIDKTGLRPHVAVDDAIEQGRLLMGLLREARERAEEAERQAARGER